MSCGKKAAYEEEQAIQDAEELAIFINNFKLAPKTFLVYMKGIKYSADYLIKSNLSLTKGQHGQLDSISQSIDKLLK